MIPDSLLSGENASFLDGAYQLWLKDPQAVDSELAELFSTFERPNTGKIPGKKPSFSPRSIFASAGGVDPVTQEVITRRESATVQIINAYRVRGHFAAGIDPLDRRRKTKPPELTYEYYGLTEEDLSAEVNTRPLYGIAERATLREVLARCQAAYTGPIGVEYMNIDVLEQKLWLQEQLETLPDRDILSRDEQRRVLQKLCDAENFERMLHIRFPGTKRFSLEGAETLIPLLDILNERSAEHGIREIVIGMAHRGRLNTLVNIMDKPARTVVEEFEGTYATQEGSGDVKYHLGYSSNTVTIAGHPLHLSLTPNPSHLEAVNVIVEGRVRAKQDRTNDLEHARCMAVLLHGDAAFAGQGLVPELLNLSELGGYRTGGTIHIIVNNQIGFTTQPKDARSSPYATGPARMLGIPIFHVNGEDPRAVAAVVEMAVEWRLRYKRDVVIDMYCYRKHGHNEGDEPSYTQPMMYRQIRARPTPREVYQQHLVEKGDLTEEESRTIFAVSQRDMQRAAEPRPSQPVTVPSTERTVTRKGEDPDIASYFSIDTENTTPAERVEESPLKARWDQHRGGDIRDIVDTTFDAQQLKQILTLANTFPEDLEVHTKIQRLMKQRHAMIAGERGMDWSLGEQAAFGSLLAEGHPVRLSGQDSGRGTFSHRHAVITDIRDGREYFPLDHISDAHFGVYDSPLSEAGVLGFELGYSNETPDGLIIWEAQFGDFANGAQVIIDQFISSTEQKWGRLSGLVMLLPHGYEGQGPEHSSARIERYLLMCADDNMQLANVTNPSQYFHLMRNQIKRTVRKPLIVFTPKSLLRHAMATSTLEDFATGRFRPVLPEVDPLKNVRRVVFCSGKIYYELLAARRQRKIDDIALIRVEMLYPFPGKEMVASIESYGEPEIVWCQEEPKNMGAWPMFLPWMWECFGRPARYVGRDPAASPATGSPKKHKRQQKALIDGALA